MPKIKIALIVSASLVLVFSFGYFTYDFLISNKTQKIAENQESKNDSQNQEKDETTDWKTYKNKEFQIQYPKDWFIEEVDQNEEIDEVTAIVEIVSRDFGEAFPLEVATGEEGWVFVNKYQKDQSITLESWVRKKLKEWATWEGASPLMVAGKHNNNDIVEIKMTELNRDGSERAFVSEYFIEKNGDVFEIKLLTMFEESHNKHLETFKNIVDSFE